jgi:hypothetical protein
VYTTGDGGDNNDQEVMSMFTFLDAVAGAAPQPPLPPHARTLHLALAHLVH